MSINIIQRLIDNLFGVKEIKYLHNFNVVITIYFLFNRFSSIFMLLKY